MRKCAIFLICILVASLTEGFQVDIKILFQPFDEKTHYPTTTVLCVGENMCEPSTKQLFILIGEGEVDIDSGPRPKFSLERLYGDIYNGLKKDENEFTKTHTVKIWVRPGQGVKEKEWKYVPKFNVEKGSKQIRIIYTDLQVDADQEEIKKFTTNAKWDIWGKPKTEELMALIYKEGFDLEQIKCMSISRDQIKIGDDTVQETLLLLSFKTPNSTASTPSLFCEDPSSWIMLLPNKPCRNLKGLQLYRVDLLTQYVIPGLKKCTWNFEYRYRPTRMCLKIVRQVTNKDEQLIILTLANVDEYIKNFIVRNLQLSQVNEEYKPMDPVDEHMNSVQACLSQNEKYGPALVLAAYYQPGETEITEAAKRIPPTEWHEVELMTQKQILMSSGSSRVPCNDLLKIPYKAPGNGFFP